METLEANMYKDSFSPVIICFLKITVGKTHMSTRFILFTHLEIVLMFFPQIQMCFQSYCALKTYIWLLLVLVNQILQKSVWSWICCVKSLWYIYSEINSSLLVIEFVS